MASAAAASVAAPAFARPTEASVLAAEQAEEDAVEDSAFLAPDVDLKMVVCVRQDLGMSKGKVAAQCGHAVLGAYKIARRAAPEYVKAWEWRGQAKIVLKVENEADLDALAAAARAAGLPYTVIEDAGRTEVEPGTRTVIGIGPAPRGDIDAITGKLRLLA